MGVILWAVSCLLLVATTRGQDSGEAGHKHCKMDLVFILDASGSVCDNDPTKGTFDNNDPPCENWGLVRDFMASIIEAFTITSFDVQVAVIVFGDDAHLIWNLDRYQDAASLLDAIQTVPYHTGRTNAQAALEMANNKVFTQEGGDRDGIDNIAIFVSDGESNVDEDNTVPAAERLRVQKNVQIYSVGVTVNINEEELRDISSPPRIEGRNYYKTPTFGNLEGIKLALLDETCTAHPGCKRMDLVFIIDGSGSICKNNNPVTVNGRKTCDNWVVIKTFTENIATTFDIGSDAVRVAVVIFGNNAKMTWDLREYNNKNDLVAAIRDLEYPDANTNTSGGLVVARESVFTVRGGDRPTVPNVAIIITDGKSTFDEDLTIPNAKRLRDEKTVTVFAVGVTDEVNVQELKEMSSPPQKEGSNYFMAPDFASTSDLLEPITDNTCGIDPPRPEGCDQMVDMVYVIDSSASIRDNQGANLYDNWDQILGFIRYGMERWPGEEDAVGPKGAMIGVVLFADGAYVSIPFGQYNNIDDFGDAVISIPYDGDEEKNTAAGLRAGRQMLQNSNLTRSNAPDVIILITDGPPNEDEDELEAEAEALQQVAQVFVLGVTYQSNEVFVRSLASEPKEINKEYWLTVDFDSIESMIVSTETGVRMYLCGGVEPEPEPDPTGKCELDIALLVDASGSIRKSNPPGNPPPYDNWDVMKSSLVQLIYSLNNRLDPSVAGAEHRFSLVRFSTSASVNWPLNEFVGDQPGLIDAIRALPYDDHLTNTPEAFKVTREEVFTEANGDRRGATNVAIILTDGKPEVPAGVYIVDEAVAEAEKLRNTSVRVMAVGITPEAVDNPISRETLSRVSSPPHRLNQNYWRTFDFRSLAPILQDLADQACDPGPPLCQVDVVFVLDYSGSIGKVMFANIRDFVSAVVDQLDVGTSSRVGAITFSDDTRHVFHLDKYRDRKLAAKAIVDISFRGGRTHTSEALRYVRTDMFTEDNGDRANVMNVAVVVTDGGSNVPDKEEVLAAAHELKQSGTHVIAVGVGRWLDEYELNAIASYPYSVNTIILPDHTKLLDDRDSLMNLICNKADECASEPCENGGTCVDGMGIFWCFCPEGFVGERCQTGCRERADVVFAMDSSGSVKKENFQKEVDFVAEVIFRGLSLYDGYHRVGALEYSTDARVAFNLDDFTTKAGVLNALGFVYRGGSTNTAEAINTMNDDMFTGSQGDRSNADNVGVVITDGKSNNPTATWNAAKTMRAEGAHLIAVGVGDNIREWELEGIASAPVHMNVLRVGDFDAFADIRDSLTDAVCNNVDECAENPCLNRGTCVDLRGGYRCNCRDGYTGNRCERECSGELDLVIVLDSSGSVRSRRFLKVLDFIVDIVQELEIGSDKTRVGMISFSDSATVAFQLDSYTAKEDVINHVQRVQYEGDRTHTAAALRIMTDDMFTQGNGDREGVDNMAIIITNANSNINRDDTLPEAIRAMVKGIHTVAVGIGHDVDWMELRGLASHPQSLTVFHAQSQDDLPGFVDDLVDSTCKIDYCDNDPCENRATCENLFRDYYCQCRSSDVAKNCDDECRERMDIIFVLDISGSVDEVYHVITNFTRRMIYGLPIQQDRAKVGIITFSTTASIQFNLNKYQTKREMLTALAFANSGGRTNTQQALNTMRMDMFTSSAGDRSGVDNKVVVVTDGRSNIEPRNTATEAREARDAGAEIFVVAVGDNFDRREVDEIASNPDSEHTFELLTVDQVNAVADQVLEELCD